MSVTSQLEYATLLSMPQLKNFFLVSTVGVRFLGWWCKVKPVKVDWNREPGDMSRGMLECHTGHCVRIFGYGDDERSQRKMVELSGVENFSLILAVRSFAFLCIVP
jgi:hypothetical protein